MQAGPAGFGAIMTNVIEIKDFSINRAAGRIKPIWKKHFPEDITPRTKLSDLTDKTMMTLALLSQSVGDLINEIVMTAYECGPAVKFDSLPSDMKIKVIEANLFLIDQVRWEILGRLGWVEQYAAEQYSLVELIVNNSSIKAEFKPAFPGLRKSHAHYDEFQKRRDIDGESMIRAMIPAALAAFGVRQS